MKWTYARDLLAPDEAAAKPLPMWVADTDKAPPVVLKALHESVDHGVFGYPAGRDGELPRRGDRLAGKDGSAGDVPREWVLQTAGIITTLKTAVQAFSAPGDSVLIQPPVYASSTTTSCSKDATSPTRSSNAPTMDTASTHRRSRPRSGQALHPRLSGQGSEVRPRRARLHARQPRLPLLHRRGGHPTSDHTPHRQYAELTSTSANPAVRPRRQPTGRDGHSCSQPPGNGDTRPGAPDSARSSNSSPTS